MKRSVLPAFAALAMSCQGHSVPTESHYTQQTEAKMETAILASGCFWGTEYFLKRIDGVVSTTVGYTGGFVENPTYEQVCTQRTGHFEATEVVFDPDKTDYETVLRMFFETHDPTQSTGQGPDIGPQYRSAIFYLTPGQKETAEKLIALLRAKGHAVATKLLPASAFYAAEGYHQDYYDSKGGTPYCHGYRALF